MTPRRGGWKRSGRLKWGARSAATAIAIATFAKVMGFGAAEGATARPGQILLQADEIMYDTSAGKVTAKGNVEIVDQNRTLKADEVTYDQKADRVSAKGHVSLQDESGNTAFADSVDLTADLREGALQGFAALIGENGRIAAASAERMGGRFTIAHAAVFTACRICADVPDQLPLWQVRAARIVHDQLEKRLYFDDATFAFLGVPVFWLPYLSQADPTVKYKSGFLLPSVGSSSYLGSFLKIPYYVSFDSSQDLTLEPYITTRAGTVLRAEYRQRWGTDDGMWLQGSIGYNPYAHQTAGTSTYVSSLFGEGTIPLSSTWKAGFGVQLTSDDTYLLRYELSTLDRLTSNAYVENIVGRDRFSIDSFFFQSLRTNDVPGQIPLALPLVEYTYIPDTKIVGGRLQIDTSALALSRDIGTDVLRGSASADWRRPFTTDDGQLITFEGIFRSDVYRITDATFDVPTASKNSETIGRVLGLGMAEWRWPFVGDVNLADTKLVVEPIAQLIVASTGGNPRGLPNEDSTTFQFDATDLFSPNPSPGLDFWAGGTRSNVGLRTTALLPTGSVEFTLGEDFRIIADPAFAPGSAFGGSESDTVGQLKIQFLPHFSLTDQFNIDPGDGALRRNEIYLKGTFGRSTIDFSYIKLPPSAADPTLGKQEQVNIDGNVFLYGNWAIFANARRDLANAKMIQSGVGVRYEDECFVVSLGFNRRDTSTLYLKPASSVILRIGLKSGLTGG